MNQEVLQVLQNVVSLIIGVAIGYGVAAIRCDVRRMRQDLDAARERDAHERLMLARLTTKFPSSREGTGRVGIHRQP